MVKTILYILKPFFTLMLLLSIHLCFSQNNNGNIEVKIDSNKITIGDQVNLDIYFTIPTKLNAKWPILSDTLSSKIEIIKLSKIDTLNNNNSITLHQKITITSFDSGLHVIPPIKIEATSKTDTNKWIYFSDSLYISVNAPAIDTTKAIKDIKEIVSAPITWQEVLPWTVGGLLLIIIIILGIYIINRYKNKKPIFKIKQKPTIPPHEWALAELDAIKKDKLWQAGQTKLYYTKITDTLRKYLELIKDINAMEMTSDEIYLQLKINSFDDIVINNFKNILTIADYVKFAKMNPLPEDHEKCISQAIEIINKTKPIINESITEKI